LHVGERAPNRFARASASGFDSAYATTFRASGSDLMAHSPRAGRMCWRGPDNIARSTRDPAAEAPAKFDTSELATEMPARPKRHGRPPPLLVGHQHSRTRKVAPRSSWLSNSSLMKRSRGSAGVALGLVAIASSLVTMRAQRAFTSAYVDLSCCKHGWFIEVPD
jgi:hypothetical protein